MAVARGDEPADLVLAGGHVLSVFTKEWLDVDIAVVDGFVVGLGRYAGRERLDVSGKYLVPGFIDAHMHIESSKLMLDEFSRAVLAHGTTAVVADPHEVANVLGTDGIHWLLDCCDNVPLDVFVMASSCVPASSFESPRRPFTPGDIESLLRRHRTIGVAEMMNFPGVIAGAAGELAKLETRLTDHVDGHAPGVRGPRLNAYIAAGIRSDHESTTFEEALEKRRLGMWVMLREATGARNLKDLLPLVKQYGSNQCMFCTDDREPDFIVEEGHINQMVRVAVEEGVSPEDAVVMATINPAVYHRLWRLGAIAPGYQADILMLDDLKTFRPRNVVALGVDDRDMAACAARLAEIGGGIVIAEGGKAVEELPLPVAGLMSDRPLAEVHERLRSMERRLTAMGSTMASPFMTLSFLALSVIPELKITDRGLVDVIRFELVALGVE